MHTSYRDPRRGPSQGDVTDTLVIIYLHLQFYPIYSEVKKSKETGNFEDFIECLKLYDKMENGTMMLGELEHILLSLG